MKTNRQNRRRFLKTLGGSLGALVLARSLPGLILIRRGPASDSPEAASGPDHFFLMLRISGGMDSTLGLDPQIRAEGVDEQDLFLEYRPEDILRLGNDGGLWLGPAAAPLAPFAPQIATINGIMMRRDVGHVSMMEYMSAGRGDGSTGVLPAELCAHASSGPYGVLTPGAVPIGPNAIIVSSIAEIASFNRSSSADNGLDLLNLSESDAQSALQQTLRSLREGQPQTEALITRLEEFRAQTGRPCTESQTVAAAFSSRAAFQAVLEVPNTSNLDTHSNHERVHLQTQTGAWQYVADLFREFQAVPHGNGTLFDHTTFMVVTEFSRLPHLNGGKGKHHNPFTNSVLLAGKNVQGGRAYGGSLIIPRGQHPSGLSQHFGAPFDFSTGQVTESRESADFIFPENVAHTVARIFGLAAHPRIDTTRYRPIPGLSRT